MNQILHKDCYGTMLPAGSYHDHQGKAFKLEDTTLTGMLAPHRRVHLDMEQWDHRIQQRLSKR